MTEGIVFVEIISFPYEFEFQNNDIISVNIISDTIDIEIL